MGKQLRGAFVVATLMIAGIVTMARPALSSQDEARAFVADLGNEAVSILQPSRSLAEREAKLEDLFRRAFDLDFIARAVVGRYWNQATPKQQDEYRRVFADFIVHTYARRLADQTVNAIQITGTKDAGSQDVLVGTVIERPDGAALNYAWRVRDGASGNKIVDVVVEGVSLTITHRADFASTLQRGGMDGLIATLKQKTS